MESTVRSEMDSRPLAQLFGMKFTMLLLIFFSFECSSVLVAQNFQDIYESGNDVQFNDMATISSGGYALVGEVKPTGANFPDVLLVKMQADGSVDWAKRYGTAGTDIGYGVSETSNGGFIIAGKSDSSGQGGMNALLILVDSAGTMTWSQAYGDLQTDVFMDAVQDSTIGYVATGYTYDPFGATGGADQDMYVVGTDQNGQIRYANTYGGSGNDRGNAIARLTDGTLVAVGMAESYSPATDDDVYVVNINNLGQKQWSVLLTSAGDGEAHDVIINSNNEIVMTGRTDAAPTEPTSDNFIIRMTAGGIPNSLNYYENPDNEDGGYAIVQTTDGGYAVAGMEESGEIATVMSVDASFGLRFYGQYEGEVNKGIGEIGTGGFLVAGIHDLDSNNSMEGFLMRTDASGNTASSCITNLSNVSKKQGPWITTNPSDTTSTVWNFYAGVSTTTNVTLTTQSACTGVNVDPGKEKLQIVAYPNPTAAKLHFQTGLAAGVEYQLQLSDVTGRLVIDVPKRSNGKTQSVALNTEGLQNGMYMLKITSPEGEGSQKILISR